MPQSWRTVRVFISSTFRDMHAERDHLVRIVFPELKERCRQRHVQLIDVDLRWGVTEEQAEGGGALDICLDEIDSCRPYFLGLLGHRYGYIPPGHEHSITAQEVHHGVLHNNLPRQLINLRPFVEGILEGRTLFKEQVSCLVHCYHWDPDKRKYLLEKNITAEDETTLRAIFDVYSLYQKDRSFFFFRSKSLTEKLVDLRVQDEIRKRPKTEEMDATALETLKEELKRKINMDYFEADGVLKSKLQVLKSQIINAGLPWSEYDDVETFGQKVLETLWDHIDAEFPEKREEAEREWLEQEAEFHELFMADRTRRFVGREDILKTMRRFVGRDDVLKAIRGFLGMGSAPWLMVVTGEPGCGKSALMARFTKEIMHSHLDWLILPHFVGASPSSTSLRLTLRRFCTHLNRALGATEEIPEDFKELVYMFPQLLERASKEHHILLIIDAFDQMERADNAHTMSWLPQEMPRNVKVVLSTLPGETLDALKARYPQLRVQMLSGLREDNVRQLVTGYLEEIRRRFPTEDITQAFHEKVKAGNPLYIMVALEELRVFPHYEGLAKRVAELPHTLAGLFDQVLERVEADFSQPLVQDFTSLIACGRQGMTAEELQTLLKSHSMVVDPANPPGKLPYMLLARLRRALSAYLLERSGVIDFFHNQLKKAVSQRYLGEEAERDRVHHTIAEYFKQRWADPYLRAVDELPHQLAKAKDVEGLESVLCDLRFIEAKCAAGMIYDLIHDYDTALDSLPEAQPERQERQKNEERLNRYSQDLIAYAGGEIKTLDIVPSVRPWTDEEIEADTQQIINSPTRLYRILAFSQFVNSESHALIKLAPHPGFTVQQAHNHARSGPVAAVAESIVSAAPDLVLLLLPKLQRQEYNPHPAILSTLEGHTHWVECVSVTPDGKRAVSASHDNTLRVWDLETGQCLKTLEGHTEHVVCVSVTPDGKRAVSAGNDHTLRVWNLESGGCLRTLRKHKPSRGVSVMADGKRAVSGCLDNTLRVWNLENGQCLKTLEGHTDYISDVSVTVDGKRAISTSGDRTARVWDLESGRCVKILEGHTHWVSSVSMTPDGKKAVSASFDETLRVWDLESGQCLKILKGHTSAVDGVSMTPDGKRAVSASQDKALRVWDLERGQCLRTLQGHTEIVWGVSVTADGKRTVSASSDKTLLLWDLERGQCLRTLQGHTEEVLCVSVTPDGKRAVSASLDDTLQLWDADSGQCLKILGKDTGRVQSLAVTADGKRAVGAWYDGLEEALMLWDLESGRRLKTLKKDTSWLWGVSTTPDGNRAVFANSDGTLWLWDLEGGRRNKILKGHSDAISSVSVTPDGKRAISASWDKTLRVWDLETYQCLRTLRGHTDFVWDVSVTPDGKRAISASRNDKTLRVWDLESGQCLKTLAGHTDAVWSVTVTPDGRRAVSASDDRTLRVWDLESGRCLKILKGHTDAVLSVTVTPDGKTAVSTSSDLRVWDLESGQCLAALGGNTRDSALAMHANGLLVVGTKTGDVMFFTCEGLRILPPVATPILMRLHGGIKRLGGDSSSKSNSATSRWDDSFKAACSWCGRRFRVAEETLNMIRDINRNAILSSDRSPCLELPAVAWDEPRLLSECPLCHKPLKFNPFIVDNRGRY
jgi:WD40 repeat protein